MLAAACSDGLSEGVGGRYENRIKDEGPEFRQRLPHGTASLVPRPRRIELAAEDRRVRLFARSGERPNSRVKRRGRKCMAASPWTKKPTPRNSLQGTGMTPQLGARALPSVVRLR